MSCRRPTRKIAILLATIILAVWAMTVTAQESPEAAPEEDMQVPEWISNPIFQYSSQGRLDPFSSFLKAREAQRQQRAKKASEALSPLERLDVMQLKLVGVVWNEHDPDKTLAMIELPDGKGFVLKKGERVGLNRGRVVSISPDRLKVLEESEDIFGDIVTKAVVLKLHSPTGDK
ncbi:MAG: pilus assembly protein PilP [Desulfovibrionales bacterium]